MSRSAEVNIIAPARERFAKGRGEVIIEVTHLFGGPSYKIHIPSAAWAKMLAQNGTARAEVEEVKE